LRAIPVAVPFEPAAEVRMVVDLPVEDNPDAAVLVRQRLLTGAQIDDRETPMRERRPLVAVKSGFVGPPVEHDLAHGHRSRRGVSVETLAGDDPCNAAHRYFST